MPNPRVRLTPKAHQILRTLAAESGESMQVVAAKAIRQYHHKHFLEGLDQDFQRLRENPQAWQEELEERAQWGIP